MTSPKKLSYHEAGHVISWLHYGGKIDFVSIDPKRCSDTKSNKNERCDGWLYISNNTALPFEEAVMSACGPIAESKLRGCSLKRCIEEGGQEDGDRVNDMVFEYYEFATRDLEDFNRDVSEPLIILTSLVIDEAKWLVENGWSDIDKIAKAILKRKTLTQEDIEEILKEEKVVA